VRRGLSIGSRRNYAETVHGIPGFESAGETTPAFDRLGSEEAAQIVAEHYDLRAENVARLETERDDSFRIATAAGDFVLKVAHPADPPEALDLQTRALAHAAESDAALPLQRILPSRGGSLAPPLPEHGGRLARLFPWLPGTPLEDTRPDATQLAQLGGVLGRLSLALSDFDHPAAEYPYAWDLVQLPRLRPLLERFPSDAAAEALERFERNVAPRLDELPRQIIHNDFNPGNVLVDAAAAGYVTGILDFGDVIRSARVCDLAVALSYQLFPLGGRWSTITPMIEGFEQHVRLEPAEREVLFDLVVGRFAQRVLINEWLALDDGSRGRDPGFRDGVRGALETLLKEN
jgi:hydroxylysine kinase